MHEHVKRSLSSFNRKEVYQVLIKWMYDGDGDLHTTIFSSYEKALQEFNRLIEQEKECGWTANDEHTEIDSFTDSTNQSNLYWQIFEPNNYNGNHSYIELSKKELL